MWTLKYYRYFCLEKELFKTKEEALSFGIFGEEDGNLSMHELLSPDGEVAMNKEQLSEYWEKYNETGEI